MNKSILRSALLAAAFTAGLAQAQRVTPPPLPPGSNLVRVEPGMNEEERKRHVRAHHHKFHHGKDVTRDDSIHGHESVVRVNAQQPGGGAGAAPGARPGSGTAPVGGAGTGPAREKTDRGASSWFSGQPDSKKK